MKKNKSVYNIIVSILAIIGCFQVFTFSKKIIRPRRFVNPKTKKESFLGETSIMHFKASKKLLKTND